MTSTQPDRAARARAAKAYKYQQRLAEKLRAAGWAVEPPKDKITTSTK